MCSTAGQSGGSLIFRLCEGHVLLASCLHFFMSTTYKSVLKATRMMSMVTCSCGALDVSEWERRRREKEREGGAHIYRKNKKNVREREKKKRERRERLRKTAWCCKYSHEMYVKETSLRSVFSLSCVCTLTHTFSFSPEALLRHSTKTRFIAMLCWPSTSLDVMIYCLYSSYFWCQFSKWK